MNNDSVFPKWLIQAGVVFFIIFIIVMAYFFVRSRQARFTSRFAVGTPILSLGAKPSGLRQGQDFDLLIQTDPKNNDFHAFDLTIKYDDNLVEFQNPENLEANIISPHRLLISDNPYLTKIDPLSKTIHIVGVKIGQPFIALTVLAQVHLRIKNTAAPGRYEIFQWGEQTKIGDYVKISLVEKQIKQFNIEKMRD